MIEPLRLSALATASPMLQAPVTLLLLLATVLASLAAWKLPALMERGLLRPFWLLPRRQWDSVPLSAMLHADLPHLLMNMFTLWAFGPGLERRIGSAAFATLYAAGVLASAAGTWWAHRREAGYASLGASGAISAVLFAAIVYQPTSSLFVFPLPVPLPAPLFAVSYLVYSQWAARQAAGRINHDAHLSGALAGLAWVLLMDPGAYGRAAQALVESRWFGWF
jgi:membrane associated rhomboid family serine protease